jgi:hypothetical protein
MKKLLGVVALAGSILVTGCQHNAGTDDNGTPTPLPETNATMNPVSPDQGTPGATNTVETPTTPTTPDTTSTTPPPPKPTTNYPMGIIIPGKKGFVKSPYAEYAGAMESGKVS